MKNINPEKEKLVREFKLMKEFEGWAGGFYRQVALNPRVNDKETKEIFEETARDEGRHAAIIQKLINIISNNL
ncbi:MAG: hypothetical protein HY443_01830 [Candidatus Nealsonbacteria bacterium]|nr:hypothetical protein [Candidatus Nealsonbacteria bacterium]